MRLTSILTVAVLSVSLFSCVSGKKFKEEQLRYVELSGNYTRLQDSLRNCLALTADNEREKLELRAKIDQLNKELELVKEHNTTVLTQLRDLSVLTATQAESVKKSLENIGAKDAYIRDIQSAMARKDSLNLALVMNLKSALADVNDTDVEIKVEKGVVYISISDKLLFRSGSYTVTKQAEAVLGKVAQVLNANPDISILVEGHTDNVPIKNAVLEDNWDLSVKRATSVTRILQQKYNIDPKRMTAGGKGEYSPIESNDTEEGRAKNRRTRIVILPELDQFFKLLEQPAPANN